jgi:hypothetical protein
VTGTVAPAEAGLAVRIEQRSGGVWTAVATATTDAGGPYATSFGATTGGLLRARLDDGSLSPEQRLKVRPAVALSFGPARAFLGSYLAAQIQPATYSARLRISVRAAGRVLARTSARMFSGLVSKRVPTPGRAGSASS